MGLKAMVRAQTMGALANSARESRDISQISARIDCQWSLRKNKSPGNPVVWPTSPQFEWVQQ